MRFREFVTGLRAILFITGLTTAAVIGTIVIFNISNSMHYWHKQHPGSLPGMFTDKLVDISKSGDRITEIIRHMRAFRVVPYNPEISVVDLNRAVKNTLSLVDRQLSSGGATFILRFTLCNNEQKRGQYENTPGR